MSYTKNLTIKEVYASIFKTSVIDEFFRKGLELDNDRLAVSALEELILRGDADLIVESLNNAFEKGQMKQGGSTISLIGRILKNGCHEVDPILGHYGGGLLRGEFMSPSEWLHKNRERYLDPYRGGSIVANAKPWAAKEFKD